MKKNKIYILRTIFMILIIFSFIIIFLFSNQNGDNSSSLSQGLIRNVLKIFIKNEENLNQAIGFLEPIVRKLAHFSIYAFLGVWEMAFMETYKLKSNKKILICLIVGFLYALSDEFHQSFIGERNASILDVLIDSAGVLFGIYMVRLILILNKKKDK